ncbi:hypothetical protein IE53DRAFT_329561 [Violaceomyces palustris]|uniref:Uncharacterized protein n=1 Tax=Violaceomyces palustris TaxID=1673888 RepID=A0ACD0NY67_9BASI|nr:hypothetical protein IE53DRAFT_329561 [Violaceomyces palustris]
MSAGTAGAIPPQQQLPPKPWDHNEFEFEAYIKNQLGIKLDSDKQICPRFVRTNRCELGQNCPRRHVHPSPLNFLPSTAHLRDPTKRTVCKHWLRGLCKKGDQCDYLHEYDLRRMPECRFFATFGFCNNGDECLYLHVEPYIKRRECENYNRGFCPKGPDCLKKHIRRVACPLYLAGFCPKGPDCRLGHIKSTPPSAQSRSNSPIQTHRPLTAAEAFGPPPGREGRQGGQGNFGDSNLNRGGGDSSMTIGGGEIGMAGSGQGDRRPVMGRGGPGQRREGGGGWKKDLSEVTCFKCGEMGHFANMCPNPNRPGNRGGQERGPGGRERGVFDRPRPY